MGNFGPTLREGNALGNVRCMDGGPFECVEGDMTINDYSVGVAAFASGGKI